MNPAMSTTITMDASGRLALPKAMRQKLSLEGGAKLRAALEGDTIQLTRESPARLVKKGKRLVIAGFPENFSAVDAIAEARAEHGERLIPSRQPR